LVYSESSSQTHTPVLRISTPAELIESLDAKGGYGIVFCSVKSQEHITRYVTLLKVLKDRIQKGTVRVFVSSRLGHPTVEQVFRQYKCTDYLLEPIQLKALGFKLQNANQLAQK